MRRAFTKLLLITTVISAFQAHPKAAALGSSTSFELQKVSDWRSGSFNKSDLPCLPPTQERQFEARHGMTQDNAYMMMAASYLAYSFWPGKRERILRSWGFSDVKIFDSKRDSTNGFWASREDFVLVALRGTQEPRDILTDLSVTLKPFEPLSKFSAQVHSGFWDATQSIQENLFEAQKHAQLKKVPLFITGHSLGGAIALLSALKLEDIGGHVDALWTFGLPKVGNNAFLNGAKQVLGKRWHPINQPTDPIPMLPFTQRDKQYLDKLADNYGNYLPILNRFAANAQYWEQLGIQSNNSNVQSPSIVREKAIKIARGFWKHLPRSYVCDLADGSLSVN